MGSGSVKENETGEARWAIAVTSVRRVSGEFYTDCLGSANWIVEGGVLGITYLSQLRRKLHRQ